MFDENFILFAVVALAGFAVTFIGVQNKSEFRRYIITGGVVTLFVGVFGILYERLSFTPFIALVLLVLSTFTLIDPLKMGKHLPAKSCKVVGLLLMFASLVFFLMFATGFPVWLWIFPLAIYAMPYTIPSWKPKKLWFRMGAWLLALIFVGIIGYHVSTLYYPEKRIAALDKILSPLSKRDELQAKFKFLAPKLPQSTTTATIEQPEATEEKPVETPVAETQTPEDTKTSEVQIVKISETIEKPEAPVQKEEPQDVQEDEGPLMQAVKEFDQQHLELKREYQRLQDKYRKLLRENNELKEQLNSQETKL